MSGWHRRHPELYEQGYGPPDPRDEWDRIRKEQKEQPTYVLKKACEECGNYGTVIEHTRICFRCGRRNK